MLWDGAAGAIGSPQELAQLAGLGVTISFRIPSDEAKVLVREFPGLEANDEIVEGEVDDVGALVRRIEMLDERAAQRAYASLRIQPPSLEKTYLALVGEHPSAADTES